MIPWRAKRYGQAVIGFFNRFPQFTFPFGEGGDAGYGEYWAKYGDRQFWGPGWKVFWWRELMHVFGGMVLSIPLLLSRSYYLAPGLMVLGFTIKEMIENRNFNKEHSVVIQTGEIKRRCWDFKNTMDVAAWGAGSSLICYARSFWNG